MDLARASTTLGTRLVRIASQTRIVVLRGTGHAPHIAMGALAAEAVVERIAWDVLLLYALYMLIYIISIVYAYRYREIIYVTYLLFLVSYPSIN